LKKILQKIYCCQAAKPLSKKKQKTNPPTGYPVFFNLKKSGNRIMIFLTAAVSFLPLCNKEKTTFALLFRQD